MSSRILLCLLTPLFFLCVSCNKVSPDEAYAQRLNMRGTKKTGSQYKGISARNTVQIESSLIEGRPTSLKAVPMQIGDREDLSKIYFLDEAHGWVGGRNALYSTIDSGNTWGKVKIDIPPQADVAAIVFTNLSVGWVALQRHATNTLDYQENRFWLMQTKDGGNSWQIEKEEPEAIITNVAFVNEQEGWLTCSKYIGLAPLRSVHLVFHTFDQGLHWADVSEELNRVAKNNQGIINDIITDIKPDGSQAAMCLTGYGKMFRTTDGGRSWQQVGLIDDDWGWPRYEHFGFKQDGRVWVMGGADSSRGMWGMILEEQDNSWKKYKLNNVYFVDALFLSDNKTLACGATLSGESTESIPSQKHGVVLSSSDGGVTWSVVYSNSKVESINAFAVVGSKYIWAVGDGGMVIRIES
jgi:photosystem II stability/assembly factor-like uncharacterized protein